MAEGYSVDDDIWEKIRNKIQNYLASNDIGDMEQVIQWNLNTGNNDPENRKRYFKSIHSLLNMLPNSGDNFLREFDHLLRIFEIEEEEYEDVMSSIRCTKGKCENDYYTHSMYKSSNDEYELIAEPDDGYFSGVRCVQCIPASYGECYDCRTYTKRTCHIKDCEVKICRECKVKGREEHDWHHV